MFSRAVASTRLFTIIEYSISYLNEYSSPKLLYSDSPIVYMTKQMHLVDKGLTFIELSLDGHYRNKKCFNYMIRDSYRQH